MSYKQESPTSPRKGLDSIFLHLNPDLIAKKLMTPFFPSLSPLSGSALLKTSLVASHLLPMSTCWWVPQALIGLGAQLICPSFLSLRLQCGSFIVQSTQVSPPLSQAIGLHPGPQKHSLQTGFQAGIQIYR